MMELISTCFKGSKAPKAEINVFKKVPDKPEIYFSKQPSDIRRIEPLLQADQNLHSICMVRDPRSVITSVNPGLPGKYFCNFRIWNGCYSAASKLNGNSKFLLVRYEELTTNPDETQKMIQSTFPWLVKLHDFSMYQNIAKSSADSKAALGTVREVSSDRIRSWEKHLPRIKYELQKHPEMADILTDLGYEIDKQWVETLNNVQPDKGSCRYPDNANPLKELEYRIRTAFKVKRYIKNIP
jgi:hypothetical protein